MVALLALLVIVVPVVLGERWTEVEENERIAKIMEQEQKEFDAQMKGTHPHPARHRVHHSSHRGYPGYPDRERERDYYGTSESEEYRRFPVRTEKTETQPESNWCYHCASPLKVLSSNAQKTVRDFLAVRRTSLSNEAFTRECIAPKNFTRLRKQKCLHRYCQTLILVDHDEGASFVMRGCAEYFGAIDVDKISQRKDNTCERIHPTLDIRECICSERKSCYAGKARPNGAGALQLHSSFMCLIALLLASCVL